MTYHAGIGPGLERVLGRAQEPHVTCDGAGCSAMVSALTSSGGPKSWLLNRKAPPGWKLERTEEPFTRKDYCPACKATVAATAATATPARPR